MTLKLLYFAALRERMDRGEETISLNPAMATVADVIGFLAARDTQGRVAFANPSLVRAAVNQSFAQPSTPIHDGDEIAFFPPVTGG